MINPYWNYWHIDRRKVGWFHLQALLKAKSKLLQKTFRGNVCRAHNGDDLRQVKYLLSLVDYSPGRFQSETLAPEFR